ncbi:hypothetical protein [Microlunatus soli]|uniref:Predicted acetyltransferase, GNAT superfamily n=1 Tax=Microlunatus soli TaxID=630515 RepID=A0A1H1UCM1_9ACTN|nr:hypothetical protein [Microlunatus soli]SDS70168.1 Predicted acetyltransferase, GNAT superfamily [Microlunatus soli]
MITAPAVSAAEEAADSCARAAAVEILELESGADMNAAAEVLRTIWQTGADQPLLHPSLLVALAHGGNYVAGAYRGDRLVGVCVGFFSAPPGRGPGAATALHSHIAGVLSDHAGQGIGTALKLHQRLWCLRRDVGTITWTFDPLVARNASFNLHRLGVGVRSYLTDFYGAMSDGVNDGQPTDRLLVGWDLRSAGVEPSDPGAAAAVGCRPVVKIGPNGEPVEAHGGPAGLGPTTTTARLTIPADIEALRRQDPQAARRWREVLRRWLGGLLDAGWSVVGFDRDAGYLLSRRARP